jgi:hypothetical protein
MVMGTLQFTSIIDRLRELQHYIRQIAKTTR